MRIYVETWYWSDSWQSLMPRCCELKVDDTATLEEQEKSIVNYKNSVFKYLNDVQTYLVDKGINYDVFKEFDLLPYRFKVEYMTEAEYEDERVNHTQFKKWLDSHDTD